MEELLALPEPPDAVVAGNNLMGVGAIQVLTEHGLTPPADGCRGHRIPAVHDARPRAW